jgi:S-DNA-T family DNA segregation ATPase FtsK/SpoIIIE
VDRQHPLLATTGGPVGTLVVGLADDPDHQRHVAFSWDPAAGPLLAVGLPGSGTSTLAATAVLAAATDASADDLHIHVIDHDAGALGPLLGLPHVGAVVAGEDRERQRRLLAELSDDLARRRASTSIDAPRRLLVIDGLAGFRAGWDDMEPTGTWARLTDLLAHGPTVGIAVVITATGSHGVPHQVLAACHQRLVFRLADPSDHAALGIPPASVPALSPGRALAAGGQQVVQVTWPGDDLVAAVARFPRPCETSRRRPASPVPTLPERLGWSDLPGPPAHLGDDGSLALAVGLADEGMQPISVELAAGGHALVIGPPRSGRTTTLRTLADAARRSDGVGLVVITASPGAWADHDGPVLRPDDPTLAAVIGRFDDGTAPLLVIVDDADRTAEDHQVLAALALERRPHRHLVAAARADRVRGAYAHWLREVQADRTGILLQPDLDLDGDLLGIRLPRHPTLPLRPGRGWVAGNAVPGLAQIVTT